VVFNSTDVDQTSWSSEEWRCTAFGHYLIEGFRGAVQKSRVNAEDLFNYVRDRVQRWAWDNRGEVQTPLLLPLQEGPERARKMEVIPGQPQYTPPVPRPANLDEGNLTSLWDSCRKLDRSIPSPAAYSPHLWRQYRDTLVRYEQLMRAGASSDGLKPLAGKLDRLRADIESAQRLGARRSVAYALPMRDVFGITDEPVGLEKVLGKLWDQGKKWEEVKKDLKSVDEPTFRLTLGQWLLDRATSDPATLEKAARIMQDVDQGGERTAEAHYLVMLDHGLRYLHDKHKRPATTANLKLALPTRRLAETAALGSREGKSHPYSELVYPWVRALVEEGDRHRRVGEDLLFAEAEKQELAHQELQQAESRYQKAQEIARRLREALVRRDQLLADLPYYTQWLADQKADAKHFPELDEYLRQAGKLWESAHKLNRDLSGPVAGTETELETKSKELKKLTEELDQGFKDQKRLAFDPRAQSGQPLVAENWHVLDGVLNVPLVVDGATRVALLNNLREISEKRLRETREQEKRDAVTEDEKKALQQKARRYAAHRGQMALAVLGEEWCQEASKIAGLPALAAASEDVANLDRPEEVAWRQRLDKANDQMGKRWRLFTREIDAAKVLEKADRWVRGLDGAGASLLKHNPAEAQRRLRLHGLLLWQAQRTRLDQWWGERKTAYYRSAGKAYLDDARELVATDGLREELQRECRKRAEDELKELNSNQTALSFLTKDHTGARLDVTSEKDVAFDYQLKAGAKVSPGHPVVAFQVKAPPDVPLVPADEGAAGNQPRAVPIESGAQAKVNIPSLKNPYYPKFLESDARAERTTKPVHGTCELRGFYRGRELPLTTDLNFHPHASTVVYQHPLPERAGVVVIAEDRKKFTPARAAISILLDYSGSMGPPEGGGEGRLDKALRALPGLLNAIPDNSQVALHIFAAIPKGKRKQVLAGKERMIEPGTRLGFWESWDRTTDRDAFLKKLKPWEPFGKTPLVDSMVEASRSLRNFDGPKTLIVLTDGGDNLHTPASSIPDFLARSFKNSEIRVYMVGFINNLKDLDEDEREGLEYTLKGLRLLDPRGEFVLARNENELQGRLRGGLWRYHFEWVGDQKKKQLIEEEKEPANQAIFDFNVKRPPWGNLEWSKRLPGPYDVWLTTGKRKLQKEQFAQTIKLNPGDLLLLRSDGKRLERALYVEVGDDRAGAPDKESGWLLSLLYKERRSLLPAYKQEFIVGVDNYLNVAEDKENHLQQLKPQGLWLELHTQGKSAKRLPHGLRWGGELGLPTPAWRLEVTETLEDPLQIKAWVSANPPPAIFTATPPFANRTVTLKNGDEVGLVSVSEGEKLRVPNANGVPTLLPCVVVRLRLPEDKLVFASLNPRVDPARGGGWEHHFFCDSAGKYRWYTGVFWSGTKEIPRVTELYLHSVEEFKADTKETRVLSLPVNPDGKMPEPNRVWREDVLGLPKG
jgi:hypothetical protein